jgi:hypothetical protein
MLLEQRGLADVAARTSVLLCREISFIFQRLAPFLAAAEAEPDRIEFDPNLLACPIAAITCFTTS